MLLLKILFWLMFLLIFHTLIGYPISLSVIHKFTKKEKRQRDMSLRPYVSIIVPVHNEETVIEQKLNNLIALDYPKELFEIIISSDNSTDRTNEIASRFIDENKGFNIKLYVVKERKGKTNAQNEAAKLARGEILVFTDANAILDKEALIHLVSSFTSDDIIYVTGKLVYVNSFDSITSYAENYYWNYDLYMRKAESDIKTITSGNGALYAIRKSEYVDFDPIKCHDGAMPLHAALNNKRAIFNEKALAFEKAGTTSRDEFKRKVRMFRSGLKPIYTDIRKYNPFRYGWFSYFYFSHRACRRLLFLFHSTLLVVNLFLLREHFFYIVSFLGQSLFFTLAIIKKIFNLKNKLFYFPFYYSMTLIAQLIGTFNQITGRAKPFWEKAESTR